MTEKICPFDNLFAKHLYRVYFGGNWNEKNWFDFIENVPSEILFKEHNGKTIWQLFTHSSYYLKAIENVIDGNAITTTDSESWLVQIPKNEASFRDYIISLQFKVKQICTQLEFKEPEWFTEPFGNPSNGGIDSNIIGIVEHLHYHLGQAILINKELMN